MKTLTKYLNEKLVVNKDYNYSYTFVPKSLEELKKIINDIYDKLGPGTKQNPIDFNDIDVSNIDSFYDDNNYVGIFRNTKFKYIDISYWDVSNVKYMIGVFSDCEQLKSVGDLSNWDVSNVKNMAAMFSGCYRLKSVGDLSNWNVSNTEHISFMFGSCAQLTSVGDLSNWNVSNIKDMRRMFYGCEKLKSVGDLSNWNVSKVEDMDCTFKDSGITNIPDWYKG